MKIAPTIVKSPSDSVKDVFRSRVWTNKAVPSPRIEARVEDCLNEVVSGPPATS
ncbi:hypothetical protein PGT21_027450 [Puccinia graminis f. sp. tritici]|uniref:Uncharacterized protein n=1 Tax=Puccinia graminis f. sp. tritici TaxID=56615 RepID=A0A5B0QX90_PUCGR|nr:hypothetical protein PGT21_027450 [Puccinia graminis f. sp. tritici]